MDSMSAGQELPMPIAMLALANTLKLGVWKSCMHIPHP